MRAVVGLPIIRKDFISTEFQILEARAAGADAVLLIVAALAPADLKTLIGTVRAHGLATLVEVHSTDEAKRAVDAGATIVGVNSRDLRTLTVLPASSEETLMARLLPAGGVAWSPRAVASLSRRPTSVGSWRTRLSAFLIGERFMTTNPNPRGIAAGASRRKPEGRPHGEQRVKICGITRERDAQAAVGAWRRCTRLRVLAQEPSADLGQGGGTDRPRSSGVDQRAWVCSSTPEAVRRARCRPRAGSMRSQLWRRGSGALCVLWRDRSSKAMPLGDAGCAGSRGVAGPNRDAARCRRSACGARRTGAKRQLDTGRGLLARTRRLLLAGGLTAS